MSSSVEDASVKSISFAPESIHPQLSSPLFSSIPPEIRTMILEYALKDYEDKSKAYKNATCYKRPDYLAPRKTDTAVLRTCKRIYMEGWWLPWASAEHAFYLAWRARSPPRVTTPAKMQRILKTLHASHVETNIEHVRIFAQLCHLEGGERFQEIMDIPYFNPSTITLTIRHTDWWDWELDSPLRMGCNWVQVCSLPKGLKEFKIGFESLVRKKDQIDDVVQQAIQSWEFIRKDGVVLSAEGCVPSIMRWSGSSIWEQHRWLRDETKPSQLDYYVSTVTWRPVLTKPATTAETASEPIMLMEIKRKKAKSLNAKATQLLRTDVGSAPVVGLLRAGVTEDMPANEAVVRLLEYDARIAENYSTSGDDGYDDDDMDIDSDGITWEDDNDGVDDNDSYDDNDGYGEDDDYLDL